MFVGAAYDWPGVPNKLLTFRRHNRRDLNSKSTRDGGGSDMGDRLRRLAAARQTVTGLSLVVSLAACGVTTLSPGPAASQPPTARTKPPPPIRAVVGPWHL